MFKKASISIKSGLLFLLALGLIHCQSPEVSSTKSGEDPSTEKRPDPDRNQEEPDREREFPVLTDENAPGFLEAYGRNNPGRDFVIHTDFGDIRIRLYEDTPLHRAAFHFLTRQDYYDKTWFHRVSPGHVIQAGNNDEREKSRQRSQIGDFKIPSEMHSAHLHREGAVAAARTYYQNEAKASNPYQFYIVLGQTYTEAQLRAMAERDGFRLSQKQINIYTEVPGAPHLDGEHSVFGQVISGMDVVREISQVETDGNEWPLENIPITVEQIR